MARCAEEFALRKGGRRLAGNPIARVRSCEDLEKRLRRLVRLSYEEAHRREPVTAPKLAVDY